MHYGYDKVAAGIQIPANLTRIGSVVVRGGPPRFLDPFKLLFQIKTQLSALRF